MYRVKVKQKTGDETWVYGVIEHENGSLIWSDATYLGIRRRKILRLKRCGNMWHTEVTTDEAILLTGVNHPMAALDRLRELIHESEVVT